MTSYVAFLRGINVGGNKMVAMAELRAMLESLGFTDVKTLLQSGNAVFRGPAKASTTLEQQLEAAMHKRFGFGCDFHVRTAAELHAAVAANPFPQEAKTDPSRLLVSFYREPLDPAAVKAAQAAIEGPEKVRADGRQLYLYFPNGQADSKAATVVGRMLKVNGTGRNWNTLLKLSALLQP